MNEIALSNVNIPAMSNYDIAKAYELEKYVGGQPQVNIKTKHSLYAGVYTRTVYIQKGIVAVGALIKIPTTIIVSGKGAVFIGNETVEVSGYHVFSASANRKQAFLALEDSFVTMLFKTEAKTVEEAENEFTDEADRLMTRKEGRICQQQ